MKIVFENEEEVLSIIHSALCNGGLSEIGMSEIELRVKSEVYAEAKNKLENPCYEDVLIQVLRDGKQLRFYDYNQGEWVGFNLKQAKENLQKEEALSDIQAIKDEVDDAWTGYNILQLCIYGELVYG